MQDYLFDSKQLTDGAPPNDRGCRFCGKIGHIQKDCPKKKINTEKREKKEHQKDHRDISRSTGVEDAREESRKQAEIGAHKEVKENPDREEKKPEQKVTAVTAKGGGTSSISLEGNSEFDIPLKMMIEHCKKWENNQQYKADGEKLLGMKRTNAASFDVGKLEKGTIVCHVVPPQRKEKFIWTFDFERAKRNVPDKNSLFINSCYGYIFKTVEVMSMNKKQMNRCNPVETSASLELPENIGESLIQKMKEVSDQRKQKKKERMKVRYRREMAGPGYKRGKKFEINSKALNRSVTHEPYVSPKKNDYGQCKAFCENYTSVGLSKKTSMSNKSSEQSLLKPYRDACSSSEDDNLPTKTVRRKGKTKNKQENFASAQERVHINKDIEKCIGVRSRIFLSKEGAIKAKHQPSLNLTHKFVAINSDKEVVTISSNSPISNPQTMGGVPKEEKHVITQPALMAAISGSRSAFPREKAQPCTVLSTHGASGGAQPQRGRHKPRPRKGKRGTSVSKPDDVNENINPRNPD